MHSHGLHLSCDRWIREATGSVVRSNLQAKQFPPNFQILIYHQEFSIQLLSFRLSLSYSATHPTLSPSPFPLVPSSVRIFSFCGHHLSHTSHLKSSELKQHCSNFKFSLLLMSCVSYWDFLPLSNPLFSPILLYLNSSEF